MVIMTISYIYFFSFIGLSSSCNDNLDCSLNGKCKNSNCIFDPPWSRSSCSILEQAAVKYPQGYGQYPNLTSRGGSILTDPSTGKHHLFVSILTNNCPLSYWQTNSRIDHAVSENITGPYLFQDIAINTWSTNPAPIALADGTFAIVHVGQGDGPSNGGEHCSNDIQPHHENMNIYGSTIHISRSLSGPWKPLLDNTLGDCNNPSPWQHNNGSLFMVCAQEDHNVLKTAFSIS